MFEIFYAWDLVIESTDARHKIAHSSIEAWISKARKIFPKALACFQSKGLFILCFNLFSMLSISRKCMKEDWCCITLSSTQWWTPGLTFRFIDVSSRTCLSEIEKGLLTSINLYFSIIFKPFRSISFLSVLYSRSLCLNSFWYFDLPEVLWTCCTCVLSAFFLSLFNQKSRKIESMKEKAIRR